MTIKFLIYYNVLNIKFENEMRNVSKRQQPDKIADNNRRPPMGQFT